MNSVLLITSATCDSNSKVSQSYLREYYLPLAHLYLSGSLARHFEVAVLDINTLRLVDEAPDQVPAKVAAAVTRAVRETQPFLVGINCLFSGQSRQALEIASLVKSLDGRIKTAVGGMPPTIFSEDIIRNCPDIDFVLQGEGEENTVALALALKNGESPAGIDGLTWRGPDGQVMNQPKTSFIADPDMIPRPAYHLFDFKNYAIDTSRWHNPKKMPIGVPVPIISSRSCPQRCNFCCMFRAMGPRFRPRSAEHVLDEMEYLYHEHQTRYFEIMDDNFTLNKKRTLEICRGLAKRKMDVQLRTISGLSINSLDEEVVDALAEAGLTWAPIAIESGSDYIRNQVMGKRLDIKKVFEVVRAFGRHPQIILSALFIIGMPEDTPETLMATYRLIEELEVDDCTVSNATPFPGTALYEQCLRENLLLQDDLGRWDNDQIFVTTKGCDFFIKPQNLTIKELTHYRNMFDEQRLQKMSPKYRAISSAAREAESRP
jgi:radical SAM superfamily enzyme YgiQ (UPF0313 family)